LDADLWSIDYQYPIGYVVHEEVAEYTVRVITAYEVPERKRKRRNDIAKKVWKWVSRQRKLTPVEVARSHTGEAVTQGIRQLRTRHAAKRTLIQRLDRAGLPK
jgi:hypothetical protein